MTVPAAVTEWLTEARVLAAMDAAFERYSDPKAPVRLLHELLREELLGDALEREEARLAAIARDYE
jgi:hypothetical protein